MERDCSERSLSRAGLSKGSFLRTKQTRGARLQSGSWVVFARAYVRSMRLYYSFVTGIAGWLGVAYYEYLAANPALRTIEVAPSPEKKLVILALLLFNVGVELGQLRRRWVRYPRRLVCTSAGRCFRASE